MSGVNNVTDGFGAEINSELSFRYAVISSRCSQFKILWQVLPVIATLLMMVVWKSYGPMVEDK